MHAVHASQFDLQSSWEESHIQSDEHWPQIQTAQSKQPSMVVDPVAAANATCGSNFGGGSSPRTGVFGETEESSDAWLKEPSHRRSASRVASTSLCTIFIPMTTISCRLSPHLSLQTSE